MAAAAVLACAPPGRAEEVWAARSGQAHFHFNVELLRDLGIDLEVRGLTGVRQEGRLLEEPYWTLAILPGSNLEFRTERGVVQPRGSSAGVLRLSGELVLRDRAVGREARHAGLEIAHVPAAASASGEARVLHLRSAATGQVLFELRRSMFDFRRRPTLEVHYLNARIAESWARSIGRPDLAGWVVGVGELEVAAERLSGADPVDATATRRAADGILDVKIGILSDIQQVARTGTHPAGTTALSMSTTSCNVGDVDVPWLAPMQEDHPLIHMAIYRLLDGRLEQIGVSWMKHGFYALSDSECSPCQNPSDGTFLGVGCSDTYDVMNNSSRSQLGPRGEVNPYAGTWECTGSHFAGGQPDCARRHSGSGHGPLDHRLVAQDADLDNPGATYFYEAYYIVKNDQNLANNWAHRRCTMTWTGSVWSFSTPSAGNPLVQSPALAAWGDFSNYVQVADGDGDVLLAVRATPRGGGIYRYEYGLLNVNSDRRIRSFSVPVPSSASLSNIAFHDNDANPSNDWSVTLDGGAITWQTQTHAQNPNAPALVFGNMVNFRFDADAPPIAASATLGIFKPGLGSSVTAPATAPVSAVAAAGDRAAADAVRLLEARPHPFRRSVTITYQAARGRVALSVHDAAGRLVRRVLDEDQDAGRRSAVWNGDAEGGARVPPGVYYALLRCGSATAVAPLVMVR